MRPRIDWHRVFDDFAYLGLVGQPLADRLGIRLPLVVRIAAGKQGPAPMFADRIVGLWCSLTQKTPEFLPRTTDPMGAPRDAIPGIELDEQPEPSFVMVWAQITQASR
jgi:hypothetical protein